MCNHEDYYTNHSPRISHKEMDIIEEFMDTALQIDHTHGAHAGPIAVYPVHLDKFRAKAKEKGIWSEKQ